MVSRFAAEEKQNTASPSAAGAKRRKMIWIVVMALFFGWAGYIFFAQSALIADKNAELSKKRQSEAGVTQSLNQLKYDVSRLNENEYIGQLARKWFNMYPQGETPIRKELSE